MQHTAHTNAQRTAKTISFDFISDPGHGWLKCHKRLLDQLGIADKISSYSYMRENYAYLEEDCDAGLLINALRERGFDLKFRERNRAHGYSRVRNYAHYSVGV